MKTEKVSVSLDAHLLAEARRRSRGSTTLSAYLNDALLHKLRSDSLLEYLDSLDEEFGPVSPQEQEAAQRWWDDMKAGR